MKNSPEKVLKKFIPLERRSVKIRVLNLLTKFKPFPAFLQKLVFEVSFLIALEVKWIFSEKKIEQQHPSGPNVNLRSVAIIREVLWG